MLDLTIFWPLNTQNLFKLSAALIYTHASTSETSLKKSCLASPYLANAEAIQITCKFKVAEASDQILELAENTCAVYSTGTINMNQVCQAKNTIQTHQISSGDTVTVEPGCYIRTMDHVISADESKTIKIQK